jgi:hypothetical protein
MVCHRWIILLLLVVDLVQAVFVAVAGLEVLEQAHRFQLSPELLIPSQSVLEGLRAPLIR